MNAATYTLAACLSANTFFGAPPPISQKHHRRLCCGCWCCSRRRGRDRGCIVCIGLIVVPVVTCICVLVPDRHDLSLGVLPCRRFYGARSARISCLRPTIVTIILPGPCFGCVPPAIPTSTVVITHVGPATQQTMQRSSNCDVTTPDFTNARGWTRLWLQTSARTQQPGNHAMWSVPYATQFRSNLSASFKMRLPPSFFLKTYAPTYLV